MKYEGKFYVDGNVIRWNSNDRIPPQDCLDEMLAQGLITELQVAWSKTIRKAEDEAFLNEYRERMANYEPSAEEMFEMRAAFGEGEEVVNIFTGKRIQL